MTLIRSLQLEIGCEGLYTIKEIDHGISIFDAVCSRENSFKIKCLNLFKKINNELKCIIALTNGKLIECDLNLCQCQKSFFRFSVFTQSRFLSWAVHIDFSPFQPELFLVTWMDGAISLFSLSSLYPLYTWDKDLVHSSTSDKRVSDSYDSYDYVTFIDKALWSSITPCIFFFMNYSGLMMFDLSKVESNTGCQLFSNLIDVNSYQGQKSCALRKQSRVTNFAISKNAFIAWSPDDIGLAFNNDMKSLSYNDCSIAEGLFHLMEFIDDGVRY